MGLMQGWNWKCRCREMDTDVFHILGGIIMVVAEIGWIWGKWHGVFI